MHASQAVAKLYASRFGASEDEVVRLLHRWISERRLDALLIDVANYSHVHHGPGIMLIGHGCQYALEQSEGRRSLRYGTRRDAPTAVAAALRTALGRAAEVCALLEADLPGEVAFATDELVLGFDDRLNAPNTPETFDKCVHHLEGLAGAICTDGPARIEQIGGPDGCFRARLRLAAPVGLAALRALG